MKKSSESGSRPNAASGVLRISPLGKLDERKLKSDAEPFKRGGNADRFDIGALLWREITRKGLSLSALSNDPFLKIFDHAAASFSDSSHTLPWAEELVATFFSINAACRAFEDGIPNWRITPSAWLLHERNGFDANEIDLQDAFALEEGMDDDPLFSMIFSEMRKIPDFERYETVVFDFFWPAGLMQMVPIAAKMKSLGKKTVLDFTNANEQADFTQWVSAFMRNPEIFKRFDAAVVFEDYGHALSKIVSSFRHGDGVPENIENVAYLADGEVRFTKPSPISEEDLFSRFTKHFHGGYHPRTMAGKRISTVRLLPYKCYWSSCFFCTINSTHLYQYQKDHSGYLDTCLDYVEKNGIGYLYLADEAIHPDDILGFAKKILERGLDITYRFRARFDSKFDDEACALLAKSGARYVGIGLECASDRVSGLINKGNELSIVEKSKIIDSFERAGIPFHNYAILGLPGERQDEMYETFLFLSKNVRDRENYTCSPNIFWLNKGSVYEKHGAKFGVEIKEVPTSRTSLELRLEVIRSTLFGESQRVFSHELHREQFLEYCEKDWVGGRIPRDFWDFIDRTGMFYHLKSFSRYSPFRKPLNEVLENEKLSTEAILAGKYSPVWYLEITKDGPGSRIRNLATGKSVHVSRFTPHELIASFTDWDGNATLRENLFEKHELRIGESEIRDLATSLILKKQDA